MVELAPVQLNSFQIGCSLNWTSACIAAPLAAMVNGKSVSPLPLAEGDGLFAYSTFYATVSCYVTLKPWR